ncbi:hypothetical protein GCM10027589_04500 [Actinocorallia lasiicapitis]
MTTLATLNEEFPGWNSWSSDEGHLYATRRRALPLAAAKFKLWRTLDAIDPEGLRAELLLQAERQERAEAILGDLG